MRSLHSTKVTVDMTGSSKDKSVSSLVPARADFQIRTLIRGIGLKTCTSKCVYSLIRLNYLTIKQ